jgi:nucleoside-specific outer membrane channel protein Tsx
MLKKKTGMLRSSTMHTVSTMSRFKLKANRLHIFALIGAVFSALSINTTIAADFHMNNSLTYLNGRGFEVGTDRTNAITLEHASDWSGGDMFIFIDQVRFDGGGTNTYTEISPRVSLSHLFANKPTGKTLKDILLAFTYERGTGGVETFLVGGGISLAAPGFQYLKINLYNRNSPGRSGHAAQITSSWAIPFQLGNSSFLIDGFFDWVFNNGERADYFHIVPQIKYDLGQQLLGEQKKLYIGFEYDYWNNKFGIKNSPVLNTQQHAISVLVKWHF